MGVFFGLSAALCWGVGDFFATKVSRRLGSLRALMLTQTLSFSVVLFIVLLRGKVPHAPASIWQLALFLGALNFIATQLLYRAFQVGKLSLVSPIASSYTVITALLALATGERPALSALCGAIALLGGVVLATQQQATMNETGLPVDNANAGILEAAIAALCFGIVFWGMDRVTPTLGLLWPVLLLRMVTLVAVTTIWQVIGKRRLAEHNQTLAENATSSETSTTFPYSIWWFIALVATGDTMAWLSLNAGMQTDYTTVVTALSSLFSGVTILMARIFMKEHLSRLQWLGVAIILFGILLVSI